MNCLKLKSGTIRFFSTSWTSERIHIAIRGTSGAKRIASQTADKGPVHKVRYQCKRQTDEAREELKTGDEVMVK